MEMTFDSCARKILRNSSYSNIKSIQRNPLDNITKGCEHVRRIRIDFLFCLFTISVGIRIRCAFYLFNGKIWTRHLSFDWFVCLHV